MRFPTHTLDMRTPVGHTLSTHTPHTGHAYFFYMRSHTHFLGMRTSSICAPTHTFWACVLLLYALPHTLFWACVLLLYALPHTLFWACVLLLYALPHTFRACVLLLYALPHTQGMRTSPTCAPTLSRQAYFSYMRSTHTHGMRTSPTCAPTYFGHIYTLYAQSKSFVPHLLYSNTCFSFTSYYGSHIL
jgi:hypothetical protein